MKVLIGKPNNKKYKKDLKKKYPHFLLSKIPTPVVRYQLPISMKKMTNKWIS